MRDVFQKTLAALTAFLLVACETTTTTEVAEDAPANQGISVPFNTDTGLFHVNVQINNEGPYTFILDTGATISSLYEGPRQQLGIEPSGDRRVTVHGVVESQDTPVGLVQSLRIGDLHKENINVALLANRVSQPRAAGILGMDIMSDYVLVFDSEQKTLTFVNPDEFTTGPYRRWARIRLNSNPYNEQDFGLLFADITLRRDEIPALIDTGAELTLMNWAAGNIRQLRTALRIEREKWELEGATGTFRPRLLVSFSAILAGNHVWRDKMIYILNYETLEILAGKDDPLIIAGADLFIGRDFVIDIPGKQMFIKHAKDGSSRRNARGFQLPSYPAYER